MSGRFGEDLKNSGDAQTQTEPVKVGERGEPEPERVVVETIATVAEKRWKGPEKATKDNTAQLVRGAPVTQNPVLLRWGGRDFPGWFSKKRRNWREKDMWRITLRRRAIFFFYQERNPQKVPSPSSLPRSSLRTRCLFHALLHLPWPRFIVSESHSINTASCLEKPTGAAFSVAHALLQPGPESSAHHP